VGLINVALNVAIQAAATQDGKFLDNLLSEKFVAAFFVGMCSILCIYSIYFFRIQLGPAIILMGAASILVGTSIGVFWYGNSLSFWEWGLLASIAMLYLGRIFIAR
jgi:hypothetical protein